MHDTLSTEWWCENASCSLRVKILDPDQRKKANTRPEGFARNKSGFELKIKLSGVPEQEVAMKPLPVYLYSSLFYLTSKGRLVNITKEAGRRTSGVRCQVS